MLRRISLVIIIITSLGAGAVIAAEAQKEKAKAKDQTDSKSQKDKEKALTDSSQGLFPVEVFSGEGGYLGVYLEEVTSERARELGLSEERGAIVMKVVADSPAEKAGLKENDVIVSFNGRRVDSVRELQRLLNETPADRSVQIEVIRGGARQTVAASLSKRSFHGFGGTLSQGFDDKFFQQKEGMESLKRSEDLLKQYKGQVDAFPRDFGDFTFVNPGEYTFIGGTRLGISAESLTDQLAEFFGVKDNKGALVASVKENSPAAKAGLKAGDVIIAVDTERVENVRGLLKALSAKQEGTIAIKVVRNRSEQTINVTLEKPEPPTPRRRAIAYRQPTLIV
jgi:serine protease Do